MRGDKMVRFSITPTSRDAWLWQTTEQGGAVRARGVAPTKRLAAALIVRDIIAARLEQSEQRAAPLPAKAA